MATYQERPRTVEAVTFEELVELAKAEGANIVEGMPWAFTYNGLAVTHDSDDRYIITHQSKSFTFRRGEVLVSETLISLEKVHYAMPVELFNKGWQRVPEVFQLEASEFVTGTFDGVPGQHWPSAEPEPSTEREPEKS